MIIPAGRSTCSSSGRFLPFRREELDLRPRIPPRDVLAAVCFLLFPATDPVSRPAAGIQGALFHLLRGSTAPKPRPSLHTAARCLMSVCAPHPRRALRAHVHCWFKPDQHLDRADLSAPRTPRLYLLRGAHCVRRSRRAPHRRLRRGVACSIRARWVAPPGEPSPRSRRKLSSRAATSASALRSSEDRLALSARILLAPCPRPMALAVHYQRRAVRGRDRTGL
jgi:hypothetical protein